MSNSRRNPPPPRRKAGRSFTDPDRPLGEGTLERSSPFGGDEDQSTYGRVPVHPRLGRGLADRAKVIAVLRKAEEFMASGDPAGDTEEGRRRALELACGRCGVTIPEYEGIVDGDEELRALEASVMDAARRRATEI